MNMKLAVVSLFCGALLLLGVGCAAPAAQPSPEGSEVIIDAVGTLVTGSVEATLAARQTPVATATVTAPAAEPTTATPCRLWLSAVQDTPLREGPGEDDAQTGQMLAGQSSEVIGRDAFNSWWVVIVDGRSGWVSNRAVALSDCANYPPVLAPPPSAGAAPASPGS